MYKGRGYSLGGIYPSKIHRKRSSTIYKGCGEPLRGVGPSTIHRRWPGNYLQGLR